MNVDEMRHIAQNSTNWKLIWRKAWIVKGMGLPNALASTKHPILQWINMPSLAFYEFSWADMQTMRIYIQSSSKIWIPQKKSPEEIFYP
jgi:hypothetical protein